MSMKFINIINSVKTILTDASGGGFQVVDHEPKSEGSKDINDLKKVLVYFSSDNFDRNSGTTNGTLQSKPTFKILLQVSAMGVFTDSDDPSSLVSAEAMANTQWDLFASQIFLILMNAKNVFLGLAVGEISNRFIDTIQKGEIIRDGDDAVILGTMDLTCNTTEIVSGEIATVGTDVTSNLTIGDDTEQNSAVTEPQ